MHAAFIAAPAAMALCTASIARNAAQSTFFSMPARYISKRMDLARLAYKELRCSCG